MAIAQPAFLSFEYGQAGSWTVTLDPAESIDGWEITVTVRAYNGGTALITKTIGSGITVTDEDNGVFVVDFSEANLTLSTHGPGAYIIQAHRTNSGNTYPITDAGCLLIRPGDGTAYPTITNLGAFAAHALLDVTLTDALATQYIQLLAAAEDWVQRFCNRKFTYLASTTYYLDGNGTDRLAIPDTPVQSLTSVNVDPNGYYGTVSGSFASTNNLTSGVDYALEFDDPRNPTWSRRGFIRRIGGVWPYRQRRPLGMIGYVREDCPGCVKVVANTGFSLIPLSLERAVWDLTTVMAEQAATGRLPISESGEGYSVSFGSSGVGDEAMPWSIQAALAPFRRYIAG